ncbi:tRNA pseudouridine synthase C [Alkalispirillum mobile]|uniref:tRNA pseudouridine synthase C n=1 Tax=Alkalispirillum mobile TaxID=85925 RepID=A0A498C3U0_9GAMM|nr:pseudouridine synthase [Alkalispirillum mobile]RLK50814.1 tRNA pseudouridine synthase C [Alkalispirillum mobile]
MSECVSPPLRILYRDEHLVAVDKPAGMAVHRSRQHPDADVLLQRLRDQLGQWVWPVHRLDPPTSGLVLFALDPETAQALGRQFRDREVEKRYLAVVRGWPEAAGVIDHPLRRAGRSERQAALTEYRVLDTTELPIPMAPHPTARYALVELKPVTGRQHQLRRHMKHISHPIIGDTTYGKGPHNRLFRERFSSGSLLLRAMGLRLNLPGSGQRLELSAGLNEEWRGVLGGAGLTMDVQ